MPLRHDPGHAQVDFGEALAVIGGVERKIHFFAMDLPHSDAGFVQVYPTETTEAFCAGQVFASERLTGALLDRLTHHVHILEMNGDSYRLKQSKQRQLKRLRRP